MVSRILLSAIVSGVVLVVGAMGYMGLASLKEPPSERAIVEQVYNVDVYQAESLKLREIVAGFGTARADREVTIAAQVSGEIVSISDALEEGGRFPGPSSEANKDSENLLVAIDQQTYSARVNQLKGRLEETRAQIRSLKKESANNDRMLVKARKDFDHYQQEYTRIKDLRTRNVTTDSSVTTAELELSKYEDVLIKLENEGELIPIRIQQMERTLEAVQEELRAAELDEERTRISAPFAGVLCEVFVELGQYVRAGDPIACLTDPQRVEIPVALSLQDFAKIEADIHEAPFPQVRLAINETDPALWTGEVVRASPKADEQSRTIMVYVLVDNANQQTPLMPGTFVQARIDGPVREDAILIPRDTLRQQMAFVINDQNKVEQRLIEQSETLGSFLHVHHGVNDGERLVLTNLDAMHAGATVNPQQVRCFADEMNQATRSFVVPMD
ncbi:efflux RND transporter periplasmic adaptor subunit [Calycomorphotria hydatis]|uniref:Toluene efflux pump periplasmic linker protein TtgA n=1 Tax=Calycomorphotria hydatis TaxID=2528027 RepID=A0A517TBS8_9PLAN|nr:efflux RND transporter periplasmic adaptor subunit [Calycomorphotria hydatis]QDT65832.1 Toluene efflux pump periplasmic linker protein TtgA precursor [Calycomorphotria hydatis]